MSKRHQIKQEMDALANEIKAQAAAFKSNGKQWANAAQEADFVALNERYEALEAQHAEAVEESFVTDRLAYLANKGEVESGKPGVLKRGIGNASGMVETVSGERFAVAHKGEKLFSVSPKQERDAKAWLTQNVWGALSGGNTGSVLIPELVSQLIIEGVRAKSVMLQSGVSQMDMPNRNVTVAKVADPQSSAAWRDELAAIAGTDVVLEPIDFVAKSLACSTVISEELAQDASQVQDAVVESLSAAMASALDQAILSGAGGLEPTGILNTAGIGNAPVAAPMADYSGPIAAWGNIAAANLDSDNMCLYANSVEATTMAGFVDSQGQYLIAPPLVAGFSNYVSNNLPAGTMLLGDPRYSMLGVRQQMQLVITREATVADGSGDVNTFQQHAIGMKLVGRYDHHVLRPAAFSTITIA